jgi:hypothetical protein
MTQRPVTHWGVKDDSRSKKSVPDAGATPHRIYGRRRRSTMSRHVRGKAAKITSARKPLAVLQLSNFMHNVHHSGVKINISRGEPPARPTVR